MALSDFASDVSTNAVTALLNGGYLRLYDASEPSSMLAELRFAKKAFKTSVQGKAVANAIEDEDSAPATGEASWFRTFSLEGEAVYTGTIGVELILDRTLIQIGDVVKVETMIYQQVKE